MDECPHCGTTRINRHVYGCPNWEEGMPVLLADELECVDMEGMEVKKTPTELLKENRELVKELGEAVKLLKNIRAISVLEAQLYGPAQDKNEISRLLISIDEFVHIYEVRCGKSFV